MRERGERVGGESGRRERWRVLGRNRERFKENREGQEIKKTDF